MEYRVICDIKEINIEQWSRFVREHPHGNIFQTPEMFKVYECSKKHIPKIFFVVNDNKQIEAVLVAVIIKENHGILGRFSARVIVSGGPLLGSNNPEVFDLLLASYNTTMKNLAVYSQFRNLWEWDYYKNSMLKNEFKFDEHLNILVDLSKSDEILWKEVHSKRRNEIRRAEREGTVFSIENSEESLRKCYSILADVYERAKLPFMEYDFFSNLLAMGKDPGMVLFCARFDGEIIGCMIALVYKNVIYDFYAGSRKEFYGKYPNDLIPWEVFLWGKSNGYKVFDFGGAGKPGIPYGVRDYKKKFGGEFVSFGRFEKTHKPFTYRLSKIGLYFWKMIK